MYEDPEETTLDRVPRVVALSWENVSALETRPVVLVKKPVASSSAISFGVNEVGSCGCSNA